MTETSRIGVFKSADLEEIDGKLRAAGLGTRIDIPHAAIVRIAPEAAVASAAETDWIVFTDAVAAEIFVSSCEELGRPAAELDTLSICSLRDDIAIRLRDSLVHTDIVPWGGKPADAIAAIEDYEGRVITDLEVMFVGQSGASGTLVQNATLRYCGIYRADFPTDAARVKALILGGGLDGFVVTDPVRDLADLECVFPESGSRDILAGGSVFAADEEVLTALREIGIRARSLSSAGSEGR